MAMIQSDIRSAIHVATAIRNHRRLMIPRFFTVRFSPPAFFGIRIKAFSTNDSTTGGSTVSGADTVSNKPSLCTADELHYVSPNNSDWRLALWRYNPPPQAPKRNHPLLLLSGVGTNAIGYDLSPGCSFARYMSGQGFDTWVLEVRGAGLSIHGADSKDIEKSAHELSNQMENIVETTSDKALSTELTYFSDSDSESDSVETDSAIVKGPTTVWDESQLVTKLSETFMRLSERVSGFLNEGQVKDLSKKLVNIVEEGQKSVSPPLFDLQERLTTTIMDFQKQLDLIVKYNWDFDHYLEEDVPAAMEYIRSVTKPKDGKLLAIGHSMGGILLYAMLSRFGNEGKDPGLAGIVTLASSLDYRSSKSALKLLIPLADPAQALSVPVVPLGAMLAAAYPFTSRPPYVFAWLNDMISAQDMMHPELLKKLVLNNFCTIPAKLLLQLTTAFREGGLRDRSGKFYYKDHLHKSKVPVLALAGDRDLICPPEAVYETVKLFREDLVTYKVFGKDDGPHYAHYDLVGGRMAVEELYPCVVEFLSRYD